VVVRDRTGEVLWSGRLRPDGHHAVAGLAPFQVTAAHAAAVHVRVGKHDVGTVGADGTRATRTVGGRH
jgi:hypothetical protein